jgi:multiple antibiotic resistance protein
MLNPLGVIPVYTTLTSKLSHAEARKVAFKAVITSLITLIIFAVGGKFIFDFFQISVNSLRVVGGVIFFMTGYDMLQAKLTRTKSNEETVKEYASDVAITPLAIPMICGPGAITVSIVLFNDAVELSHKLILLGVIVLILLVTLLFLLSGRKIISALGENGNKVLMRIMGLIVMVISVEFLFSGLKPIIRDILMIK